MNQLIDKEKWEWWFLLFPDVMHDIDMSRAVPFTQDMFRVYLNDVRHQIRLLQPW